MRSAPPSELVESVAGLWSAPSDFAATRVHHGYRRVVVVSAGRLQLDQFADMLADFAPVWDAWLSWIDPGGFVVEHQDAGPHRERWQIPLTEAGELWQSGRLVAHQVGVPFQVRHDLWHEVRNPHDSPRISLVIDRDVITNPTRSPFTVRSD